jgi:hypothetical protein
MHLCYNDKYICIIVVFISVFILWVIGKLSLKEKSIGRVMVSVFTLNVVDHGFESQLGQTKGYNIGMYCLPAIHASLKEKTGWLRN